MGTYRAGAGVTLVMQNDGNLVLYAPGDVPMWASKHGRIPSTLQTGQELVVGQALISPEGGYRAVMQADGNFVVYGPDRSVRWASNTQGSGARTTIQRDGNLVTYSGWTWASRTPGTGNAHRLVMQDDGNLVIYADWGGAIWSTKFGPTWAAKGPVFVYGTLRPGESAYGRVSGNLVTTRGASMPDFSMYIATNGRYPYAVEGGDGIRGDLLYVQPERYNQTIATMDAYERYDPNQPATNQAYIRVVRTSGDGVWSWIYIAGPRQAVYVKQTCPWLASGDWKRR